MAPTARPFSRAPARSERDPPSPGGTIPAGLSGQVAPRFEPVARAFADNFERDGEIGAAVCISVAGDIVVDLWAGVADSGSGAPWLADTRAPLFSTGKGMIAVACALAVSRGMFSYDDAVERYWPRFAQHGKKGITVRQILDHSAGLVLFGRSLEAGELDDPSAMARVVEATEPVWRPGEAWGYHLATFGTLLSQLIARTDPQARSLGRFFAEEIAAPLDLDIRFTIAQGDDCAEVALPGVAQFRDVLMRAPFSLQAELINPFSLLHRTLREVGLRLEDKSWLRHDLPSGNAVGSARSVARLYAAVAGGGNALGLDPKVMAALSGQPRRPSAGIRDRVMGVDNLWSLGFVRPAADYPFSPSSGSFGMPGLGGSFGFADPSHGIGYGYTPGRLGLLPFDDRRDARLRRALYAILGSTR
jgi:CubicO group peptidase (beta-lactamase class C family)